MMRMGAMGLALLAGVAAGAAQAQMTEDPVVQQAMVVSDAAARVITGCPSIGADQAGIAALGDDLAAHVTAQGYGAQEAGATQAPEFRARIATAVDKLIGDLGFDPATADGLCGFGADQIARATPIGAVLARE